MAMLFFAALFTLQAGQSQSSLSLRVWLCEDVRNLLLFCLLFFLPQMLHTISAGNHKKCCTVMTYLGRRESLEAAGERQGRGCMQGRHFHHTAVVRGEHSRAGGAPLDHQTSICGGSVFDRNRVAQAQFITEKESKYSHHVPFGNLTIAVSLSTGRHPEQE